MSSQKIAENDKIIQHLRSKLNSKECSENFIANNNGSSNYSSSYNTNSNKTTNDNNKISANNLNSRSPSKSQPQLLYSSPHTAVYPTMSSPSQAVMSTTTTKSPSSPSPSSSSFTSIFIDDNPTEKERLLLLKEQAMATEIAQLKEFIYKKQKLYQFLSEKTSKLNSDLEKFRIYKSSSLQPLPCYAVIFEVLTRLSSDNEKIYEFTKNPHLMSNLVHHIGVSLHSDNTPARVNSLQVVAKFLCFLFNYMLAADKPQLYGCLEKTPIILFSVFFIPNMNIPEVQDTIEKLIAADELDILQSRLRQSICKEIDQQLQDTNGNQHLVNTLMSVLLSSFSSNTPTATTRTPPPPLPTPTSASASVFRMSAFTMEHTPSPSKFFFMELSAESWQKLCTTPTTLQLKFILLLLTNTPTIPPPFGSKLTRIREYMVTPLLTLIKSMHSTSLHNLSLEHVKGHYRPQMKEKPNTNPVQWEWQDKTMSNSHRYLIAAITYKLLVFAWSTHAHKMWADFELLLAKLKYMQLLWSTVLLFPAHTVANRLVLESLDYLHLHCPQLVGFLFGLDMPTSSFDYNALVKCHRGSADALYYIDAVQGMTKVAQQIHKNNAEIAMLRKMAHERSKYKI